MTHDTGTCLDCDASKSGPWSGYSAGCPGCVARGLARTRIAAMRRVYGIDRQYRALLEANGISDEDVQAAAREDFECREGGSRKGTPVARSQLAQAVGVNSC